MSMSTNVIGFVPPDERFMKMKQIWDNCTELDVQIPANVYDFFDGCAPDENGMEVEIKHDEWDDGDMSAGIEINVDNIPDNVKVIRFFNSY
jgi:hypothetical protein